MKKTVAILLSLLLVVSVSTLFVSAEGDNLIPSDGTWEHEDNQNCSCNAEFKDDGTVVFSGSAPNTWPAISCLYEKGIAVDINEYSLRYDFSVDVGNTNISFIFSLSESSLDNGFSFPISNSSLGNVMFDYGSGDLNPGDYSGVIPLSELVAATTNYDGSGFNANYVVDNQIVFSGIKVYSVGGATITVNALEIVANDDLPESSESSEEPVPSEDDTTSEASSEDDTTAAESSAAESSEASSEAASSAQEETGAAPADGGDNTVMIIIICVAAVVVIAVVCGIVISKKKKK